MKKLILIALFIISGVFVTAQVTPGINLTQKNHARYINHGVKSGQLTKNELQKLVLQQRLIQLQKTMMKADGVITKKERARLKKNQERAKANIYTYKHN